MNKFKTLPGADIPFTAFSVKIKATAIRFKAAEELTNRQNGIATRFIK